MTWKAQVTIYSDSTDLVMFERWGENIAVAQPVEFTLKEQKAHEVIAAPTLRLPGNAGQQLLQALWDAGLRPSDGAGSGAEAKALRDHIKLAENVVYRLLDRTAEQHDGEHK